VFGRFLTAGKALAQFGKPKVRGSVKDKSGAVIQGVSSKTQAL